MTTSESINEIATALAKAQGEMEGASKSAANPFFKSKYADLASVWEACRAPLAKYGLSVLQAPSTEPLQDGGVFVSVETRLMHASGQWICGSVSAAAKDGSPQAVGSCITYLRRYALQSFAGVAPEDDDAEAAQGRGAANPAFREVPPPAPKGFEDWLIDLESQVPEGMPALEKAWKASKAEYRQYLTTSAPKKLEEMKAAAVKYKVLVSELA